MRGAVLLVLLCVPSVESAQITGRVRALLEAQDTADVRAEVARRPNDARDLLSDLIAQAGHQGLGRDSVMRVALRLAAIYATVWADSFPLWDAERFARMTSAHRLARMAADSLRRAGNAAYASRGPPAAIATWRASYSRAREIADTSAMGAALGNIGAGFYRLGDLDSATHYLDGAHQLAEAVGDSRTAANALGTLGSVAKDRGALVQAKAAYRRALELRTRIGDVAGASADHNNLGLIASAAGDDALARREYREALRIAREHQLDDATATALLNLGNLASGDADYEQALADYGEALRLDRKLGNEADVALVLQDLARLELRTGDYRLARGRLLEALSLFTKAGTTEDVVEVHRDLAAVEAAIGNLREAIGQLGIAERLVAGSPSPAIAADIALAQGDVAIQLNEYGVAERAYSRAQSLYRRAGDVVGEAEARQGAASLFVKKERYGRARALLEGILRAEGAAGARRAAALTRLSLGYVHEAQRDTAGARALIGTARDSLHVLGDAVGEAATLVALGGGELDTRSAIAAEADYRRGLALIGARPAPEVSWQLHLGLGEALRARGAPREAVTELRKAVTEVERVTTTLVAERRSIFLTDKWQPYADLALINHERGADSDAFVVSERMRARQMVALLARGAVSPRPTADSAAVVRERALRRQIAELTQRLERAGRRPADGPSAGALRGPDLGDPQAGVTREALAQAQAEYEQVLIALDDDYVAEPPTDAGAQSWRTVARRLRRDQAMLEYLVTDSTTLLFVVRPDTMQSLDLGIGRQALASLVEFARGVMGRPGEGEAAMWRKPLRRLYATLVAPAEEAGLLDGVRELAIVPHAELHYLPFGALVPSGRRDEFLIERYDIGYAPSASVWLRIANRGTSADTHVLALAPRARTLPGTRAEMHAIRMLYGRDATILTDGDATERAWREGAGRYGIVHLATYGVLNQHNPLFSFVELNPDATDDGRLEVHEVFGIALHARLVVLSACETGLASGMVSDVPPGDDWVGLVRAFLAAGAEHVIATLWPVEDRSTATVMERLHRNLKAGLSVVAALSDAQRAMLRKADTAGPFYWAGLVAVGGATP